MSIQSEINRINNEVDTQSDLITQLEEAISNLPEAGGGEFTEEDLLAKYNEGLTDGAEKVKTEEARTSDDVTATIDIENDFMPVSVPKGYYATDVVKNVDLTNILDNRYDSGYEEGVNYIKTEEARDNNDIYTYVEVDAKNVEVTVTEGYYAVETVRNVNVEPVYDAGYDSGYSDGLAAGGGGSDPTTVWEINETPDLDSLSSTPFEFAFTSNGMEFVKISSGGPAPNVTCLYYYSCNASGGFIATPVYTVTPSGTSWTDEVYRTVTFHEEITDEGLLDWLYENATLISSGGGGGDTDPLLEEMLIDTDYNYDDEGKQFYSVYKWLSAYHTNFSSVPFTLSIMNNHPTLYMHVYISVYGAFYSEETDSYSDERFENHTLTIGPDQEENSIEVDAYVYDYHIEGVRWSEDGV